MKTDKKALLEGYKRTEIGMIPEDWEVKELESICQPSKEIYNPYSNDIEMKCIDLEHISQNDGRLLNYSSTKDSKSLKTKFSKGDVLFGKLRPYLRKYFYPDFDGVCTLEIWVLKSNQSINSRWLYYLVQTNAVIESANQSTGTKMPRASWDTVAKTLIPIPSLSEQGRIAEALGDVDRLIEELENLAQKKRMVRQGAMQSLLTGRIRITGGKPGKPADFSKGVPAGYKKTDIGIIPSDWEVAFLKNNAWFQEGPGIRNWQFTNEGIKVINVTNLQNGYLNIDNTSRYVSIDEFNHIYKHFEIDENDIVIASSGNSYGKVSVVRKKDLPLLMNTSVIRFKATNVEYMYLLTYLKSFYFMNQINLLITGGAQPNFGPYHLNKVLLPIPPFEEQTAIATVLSDMDKELEAIGNKLEKYRSIRQAMMQSLLTGKVRLA